MKTRLLLLLWMILIGACKKSDSNDVHNSTVFVNGDILTMQGTSPSYVEALVVQDDKIAFSGTRE